MTAHDVYAELLAGHALSALEPEDELVLLHHLPSCGPCTRELVAAHEVLAQLAYVVEPVDPPADLFDRIRAGVLETHPDAFATRTGLPVAEPVVRLDEVRRKRLLSTRASRLVGVAAAVAIAAVAALGAWNVSLQRENDRRADLQASARSVVEMLETGRSTTVPMMDPSGAVRSVAVLHDDRMSLVVDGLAPNDATDSTYVLWGVDDGAPLYAIDEFDVSPGGVQVVRDIRGPQLAESDRFMITREPGRTAPKDPTLPVLADGRTTA